MEKKHTYTLQEFQDAQFKQLQEVQLYIPTKIGPDIWHAYICILYVFVNILRKS